MTQNEIGRLNAASVVATDAKIPVLTGGDLVSASPEQIIDAAVEGVARVARVVCTLAEINAGKVIIPAVAGKQVLVTDFAARVAGNFTTTTSVDLQASTTTATKVQVMAVAALTDAAVLKDGTSDVTRGAAMYGVTPAGEGVSIANVGTAAAGGTSITVMLTYNYV
jgi:hypothetical protein